MESKLVVELKGVRACAGAKNAVMLYGNYDVSLYCCDLCSGR